MKKPFFLGILFFSSLLMGCEGQTSVNQEETKNEFVENDSNITSEKEATSETEGEFTGAFFGMNLENRVKNYLSTLTPKSFEGKYPEIKFNKEIASPVRIFTIVPQQAFGKYANDFAEYAGSKLYFIFYQEKPISLDFTWNNNWGFGAKNASGFNDFYILKDPNGKMELYKNFETIVGTEIAHFVINQNTGDEYWSDVFSYDGKGTLKKNGEVIDETSTIGFFIPHFIDTHGKLIYSSYLTTDEGYDDCFFSLKKEGEEKPIGGRSGNFLTCGTYTIQPLPDGNIALGRAYEEWPDDIKESKPTITKEILNQIAEQEKTILKYYRLLDQKKWDDAYAMLDDPQISLDDLKKRWDSHTLLDVEGIRTPNVIFDSYPKTQLSYLETLGNLNQFEVMLFQRGANKRVSLPRETLQVIDNQKIKLGEYDNNTVYKGQDLPRKEYLIKLYYHLISTHRFEEAYAMQYAHTQTLDQFRKNYENILGIVIQGWDRGESEKEGNVEIIVDFVSEEGVERYDIIKEVIGDKLKSVSSKRTSSACIVCDGYGYKPVIYLYPKEETKVHIHLPIKGNFTVTYPEIGKNSTWNVIAQPNGTLTNTKDGLEYSYLFREGKMNTQWEIKQGFVVKKDETVKFLQEKLSYLGLTPREYNEFIVYWWPLMMKNEWNLISFLGEEYTSQAPLNITPKPDSAQRVFMIFKGIDKPVEIKEQILKPWEREGFAVVERGGSEIL